MATNFEFYLPEMRKRFDENKTVAMCDLMRVCDHGTNCKDRCADCILGFFAYLTAEHIEQPKLTKRERAFCEAVQTGWIASSFSGVISWFENKPEKGESIWKISYGTATNISAFELFGFITWKDEEPWAVEDLLKLEVEE